MSLPAPGPGEGLHGNSPRYAAHRAHDQVQRLDDPTLRRTGTSTGRRNDKAALPTEPRGKFPECSRSVPGIYMSTGNRNIYIDQSLMGTVPGVPGVPGRFAHFSRKIHAQA